MRSDRARYRIKIRGVLSCWGVWFDNFAVTHEANDDTTLTGEVPDQAALQGLISRIGDLGLTLVAIERSESGEPC